jgi:hypothetical protein
VTEFIRDLTGQVLEFGVRRGAFTAPVNSSQVLLAGDFVANRFANRDDALVDDSVKNLNALAAFAQNASLVQRVQMLRHIGCVVSTWVKR